MCARLGKDSFFFSFRSSLSSLRYHSAIHFNRVIIITFIAEKISFSLSCALFDSKKTQSFAWYTHFIVVEAFNVVHCTREKRWEIFTEIERAAAEKKKEKMIFIFRRNLYMFYISLTHFFSHRVVSPRFEIFIFIVFKDQRFIPVFALSHYKTRFYLFYNFLFSLEIRLVLYFHTRLDFICRSFFFGYILDTFLFVHACGAF